MKVHMKYSAIEASQSATLKPFLGLAQLSKISNTNVVLYEILPSHIIIININSLLIY